MSTPMPTESQRAWRRDIFRATATKGAITKTKAARETTNPTKPADTAIKYFIFPPFFYKL